MKYYFFTTLIILLFNLNLFAQDNEKVTLSGYIKDASNGETLIGAAVYIQELKVGTVTNLYGFYSISIPKGTYTVEFSYIGYEKIPRTLELNESLKLDLELAETEIELAEVTVLGESEDVNVSSMEMSVNKLEIKTIQKIPALLGEVDVIRSIQFLPGVSTVGEGATGFNVRGGSIDQNLVLIDEAPVYNSSHLFGFFSVFNPDAVKDVKLYKGGVPAQYGGRLSSILDVRMKEGNSKRFSASGGVGAIFSRLTLEGPIVKDKASFIVAGRRSYIDILARPFLDDDLQNSAFNFYDLTMKTNYNINDRNRIYLSGYLGRDNFQFGEDAGFNWGNGTATFRWNRIFNDRLFSNFTVFYSKYDYELEFADDDATRNSFTWNSSIVNYSLKPEFNYYLNANNSLTFGGQLIIYDFEPGNAVGISEGDISDISLDHKFAAEASIFIGNEHTISPKLSLQYGLRFSYFNYLGQGTAYEFEDSTPGQRRFPISSEEFGSLESIQTYNNLEPRFSLKYQLTPTSSFKASYNRMAQYLHLVSNGAAATPLDVWTPSTNNIRPQTADQVALGYFRNFKNNMFETSLEVYYKDFNNLVEYIDGADLLLNEFLEGDLLTGDGRAYGMELLIKKNKGKLTGWLAYTLARSERQLEGINKGDWFPNRFDQTHNFNLLLFYEVSKRLTVSTSFSYISGTPTTFPTNRIEFQGYIVPHNSEERRNNARIPDYHRLDFSATLYPKEKPDRKNESYWVFSLYNAYSRRNPFSIYFRQQQIRPFPGQLTNTEAVQLSVVGNFIPSVSYNFKF